jgi:hypothetical protein
MEPAAFKLPGYWLRRPKIEIGAAERDAFDRLIDRAVGSGASGPIDYDLPNPKWQFLCYAADSRGIVLHGSGNPAIRLFEPRQSGDLEAFGAQCAVYAASDGIWAMFFAVADRGRFEMSLANACIRLVDASGRVSEPAYLFSVSKAALPHRPFRSGTVYLLPRATFVEQPAAPMGGGRVQIAQLASLEPVMPFARLSVDPEDFPFLDQVRGHDDSRAAAYAQAIWTWGPWPAD